MMISHPCLRLVILDSRQQCQVILEILGELPGVDNMLLYVAIC